MFRLSNYNLLSNVVQRQLNGHKTILIRDQIKKKIIKTMKYNHHFIKYIISQMHFCTIYHDIEKRYPSIYSLIGHRKIKIVRY